MLLEVTDESDDGKLNDVVLALQQNREDLRVDFSEDEKLAVVTNVDHDQLDEMLQLIRSQFGSDVKAQPLPTRYRGAPQAVYCRKIFFDQRDPSRFINLVLVLPY